MKASNQSPPPRPDQQRQPRFAENRIGKLKGTQLKKRDFEEQIIKPQKVVPESDDSLTSVSEVIPATKRESVDSSEVIDSDPPIDHLFDSFMLSPDLVLSASSETFDRTITSPNSLKIINDELELGSVSKEISEVPKLDNLELQVIAEFLGKARKQIMNASDVDERSKNLLAALVEVVIKDFYSLPEERVNFSTKVVSAKVSIGFISFLIWIVLVFVILISKSGAGRSISVFDMPPPS